MTPSQRSKRFTPSRWLARLVPILLILLILALVATVLVVALAVAGVTPGR